MKSNDVDIKVSDLHDFLDDNSFVQLPYAEQDAFVETVSNEQSTWMQMIFSRDFNKFH